MRTRPRCNFPRYTPFRNRSPRYASSPSHSEACCIAEKPNFAQRFLLLQPKYKFYESDISSRTPRATHAS